MFSHLLVKIFSKHSKLLHYLVLPPVRCSTYIFIYFYSIFCSLTIFMDYTIVEFTRALQLKYILSRINPIPRIDTICFKIHSYTLLPWQGLSKGLFPLGLPVLNFKSTPTLFRFWLHDLPILLSMGFTYTLFHFSAIFCTLTISMAYITWIFKGLFNQSIS